jgi:hypothetical protein
MVYFKTKDSKLGIFWRAMEWKMKVPILPFVIVCGNLVYLLVLVCLDEEKSGNPCLLYYSLLSTRMVCSRLIPKV